jgi:dTMP kinase
VIVCSDTCQFSKPSGFIVLEGVNGAGKTTLLSRLKSFMDNAGVEVCSTREPGAGSLGAAIRSIVLSPQGKPSSPWAEFFLFAADRAEHVKSVIAPALERKQIVLCDRFLYSSEAFQGYGRGLSLDEIKRVNDIAVQGVYPDLVFLLDLPAEVGLRRNATTQKGDDSFELEELGFHQRLRDGFLTLASERPEQFVVLDASQPAEAVAAEALKVMAKYLEVYTASSSPSRC